MNYFSTVGLKCILLFFLCFIALISVAQSDSSRLYDALAEMSLKELMEVKIITGNTQLQNSSNVPASIVVVDKHDIERFGYRNLEEILAQIPGFYSMGPAYWEGGTNFGIRGFSSGGALTDFMILIDGVSQMQDFSNSFSIDKIIIPVESIERIEVVRGPNSVIYGSSAFMGAVNIITKKNSSNLITTRYGTNTSRSATGHFSVSKEGMSVAFNSGIDYTNGIDVAYTDLQSDIDKILAWGLDSNARTGGQYQSKKHFFNVSGSVGNASFAVSTSDHNQGIPGSKPSANTDDGYVASTETSSIVFRYDYNLPHNLTITPQFYFYNFNQVGNTHWDEKYSFNLFNIRSKGYQVDVTARYNPVTGLDVVAGALYRSAYEVSQTIDYPTLPFLAQNFQYKIAEGQTLKNSALFAQVEYNVNKYIILIGGMRAEKIFPYEVVSSHVNEENKTIRESAGTIAYDDLQLIPRVASVIKFSDRNVLKLMYGQSNKRPSLLEDFSLGTRKLNDLNFAHMRTAEINYSRILNNEVMLSVGGFYNDLDNLVIRAFKPLPDGSFVLSTYNAGEMSTMGTELTLRIKPTQNINFDASIVAQKTEDHTEGYASEASYAPQFLGYFNGSIREGHFTFSINGRYVGEMYSGWDIASEQRYGLNGTVKDYLLLNANIRFDDRMDKFFAALNCLNLLNQEYRYPITQNSQWTDKGMMGFGRRVEIHVGYRF